jgi:hypothetical protein
MKNFIKILGKKSSVEKDIHSRSQQRFTAPIRTHPGHLPETPEDSSYAALQLCQLSKNPEKSFIDI